MFDSHGKPTILAISDLENLYEQAQVKGDFHTSEAGETDRLSDHYPLVVDLSCADSEG